MYAPPSRYAPAGATSALAAGTVATFCFFLTGPFFAAVAGRF